MNKLELIELLSDKEHAGWAHWMQYLFSKCEEQENGSMKIPNAFVARWQRQAATPYEGLSDKEQQSDRNQVAEIMPFIDDFIDEHLEEYRKLIIRFAAYTQNVTPRSPRAKALRKQAEFLLREETTNATTDTEQATTNTID